MRNCIYVKHLQCPAQWSPAFHIFAIHCRNNNLALQGTSNVKVALANVDRKDPACDIFGHVSYTQKKCQNCQCSSRCRSTSSQPSKIKMEQLTYLETVTVHVLTSQKNIQKNLGIKLSKVHFKSLVVQHKSMRMIKSQKNKHKPVGMLFCFIVIHRIDMWRVAFSRANVKRKKFTLRTQNIHAGFSPTAS